MIFLRRNISWLGVVGTMLAALAVVYFFFPFVFAAPNNYFFMVGGDGTQSYYATAYYALYDAGQHFSGMNYPFGEHFNYPNLQPLIALGIGFLQRHGIPAAYYTIGITNIIALLGLAAAPVVLYIVLRHTRLPVGYALLTALLIGFLSPQVDRLGGHMSLSYAFFVPLMWYWIIRLQEEPYRLRWYIWFVVGTVLIGLVQVYFLACGCFFLLAHALIISWQRRKPWALVWRLALTGILPLVLFRGWLWFTDPITDRPPNPYGLLVYVATPGSVFTPTFPPLRDLWQSFFTPGEVSLEGWAYVGVVSTLVLLFTLLGSVVRALRRRPRLIGQRRARPRLLRPALPSHLHTGLWAAGLLLIFSFGIPFILPGMSWLVKYAGPIKQFRSLGRFAWPFYYVLGVYSAYYLYRAYRYQRLHRRPAWRMAWLPLALLVWTGEAGINLAVKASQVSEGAGAAAFMDPTTSVTQQLSWSKHGINDYQAILPLPYFNIGSDKTDLSGSQNSLFQGYKTSFATGLPLLASYMPRPSLEQVMRHVQLLSGPLVEKPLLAQFPSRKPILLLVTPDYLTPAEQRLVSLAKLLVSTPEVSLYELTLDSLAATDLPQERAKARALLPTLPRRTNGLQCTTSKGVLWQSFDQLPDHRGRQGSGAFYEPDPKFSVLYNGPVPAPADTGRYEVSAWVNGKMAYGYGNMQVKQYAHGEQVDHQVVDGRTLTEFSGDWARIAVPIRIKAGTDRLEVLYDSEDLLVDDLLIRPLDTDVYWYDKEKKLVLNGYQLEK
jgi:hypothetical protein